MKQLGLIGHPLSHSFSAEYFSKKFRDLGLVDYSYELIDLPEISKVRELHNTHPDLIGLNVTIPYKEIIMLYLDEVDAKASEIGAVNTILIKNGKWKGYNTDYNGFRESFLALIENKRITNALVLGSGGSSKAVQKVLEDLEISYEIVSRENSSGFRTYDEANDLKLVANSNFIVNTTPLGMFPKVDSLPRIDYQQISPNHILMDLVYNPPKTAFLLNGEKRGASIKNGLEMLYIQAERAWKIWTQNK